MDYYVAYGVYTWWTYIKELMDCCLCAAVTMQYYTIVSMHKSSAILHHCINTLKRSCSNTRTYYCTIVSMLQSDAILHYCPNALQNSCSNAILHYCLNALQHSSRSATLHHWPTALQHSCSNATLAPLSQYTTELLTDNETEVNIPWECYHRWCYQIYIII